MPFDISAGSFAGAAPLDGADVILAAATLFRLITRPQLATLHATAALAVGSIGGRLGSGALVGALIFT